MEIPKTLWLKKHMAPERFARCQFFDLPDFLTYKATGDNQRSCCSVTCKCSFVPTKNGWQPDFFQKIGLGQIVERDYAQLGAKTWTCLPQACLWEKVFPSALLPSSVCWKEHPWVVESLMPTPPGLGRWPRLAPD